MALLLQIISLVTIIGLGFYAFYVDQSKASVKKLVATAFFVVLSIVFDWLAVRIAVLGFDGLRISLSQVPLMLLGALLGPKWGFIGALVQDIIGLLVNPTGFPFLGFTLNKIVYASIPAYCFKIKRLGDKSLIRLSQMAIGTSFVFSLLALFQYGNLDLNGLVFDTTLKIVLALILLVSMIVMVYGVDKVYHQKESQGAMSFAKWTISVIFVEISVKYVLTPLWLATMYGIPYMTSLILRLITGSFMVLTYIVIGFVLYRVMERINIHNG